MPHAVADAPVVLVLAEGSRAAQLNIELAPLSATLECITRAHELNARLARPQVAAAVVSCTAAQAFEVLEHAELSARAKILFVACSEHVTEAELSRILSAGADALTSPYSNALLRAKVGRLISGAQVPAGVFEVEKRRSTPSEQHWIFDAFESTSDGFISIARDWRFTHLNAVAERVLGRTRDDLLGKNLWTEYPEVRGTAFGHAFELAMAGQTPAQLEEFYPPFDAWFEVRAFPSPNGISLFFRDVSERRRREAEHQLTQTRLQSIFDASLLGLAFSTVDGQVFEANDAFLELVGYTRDEMRRGMVSSASLTAPEWRAGDAKAIEELLRDGSTGRYEKEYLHRDGYRVPVLVGSTLLREHQQRVSFIVDMRERKAAQLELASLLERVRRSEEHFRLITDMMPQIVWTSPPDGALDYFNHQCVEYTGRSEAQLAGAGWLDVLHPDDVEAAAARWSEAVSSGLPYEMEFRIRRGSDGQMRWHIARAQSVRDVGGSIIKWFGTCTDIHDQKEAEQKLRRSEMRLRALAESNIVGVLFFHLDGGITSANDAFLQMIGYSREDLENGRIDWRALTPEEWNAHDASQIEKLLRDGKHPAGEKEFFRKDGSRVSVIVAATLFPGSSKQGAGFILDISEKKRGELERDKLIAALERSNQELDQFAYAASHDLKAPLRGIVNLAQWVEDDLGDALTPEARRHLDLMRARVHRLQGLIEGIFQYSRVGRVKHATEGVDVGLLISEAIELLAPPADTIITVAPNLPVLCTERAPFNQVLMNLIGNALKHAKRAGARIDVRATELDKYWQFEVQDNGQGIDPQFHERIWGMFRTLEPRDKVEGSGIGLAIVKKIVESRSGRVWVESALDQGATFKFTWPKSS